MTITETQTRADLIDAQLGASGWNDKDSTQVFDEFDILTRLPDGVAEPRTRYEGHQQSPASLEAFYGALSQQAFKGVLDLLLVPLPVTTNAVKRKMPFL